MTKEGSHVWAKFYYWDKENHPVQLNVTLALATDTPDYLIDEAIKLATVALDRGLYVDYPTEDYDLESGQSLVEADSAIRRKFTRRDGQDAHLIDFFMNGYEFRVSYMYVNNDRDKAYLEHAVDLVYDSMPVVEGNQAVTRPQGQPHASEVRLPQRVKIVRDPDMDKSTGQQRQFGENLQWLFNHFLGIPWETSPEKPKTKVDVAPGHLTEEEYQDWRVKIVLPGQEAHQLLGLIRVAMAEKLPELVEQYHEKMMVMVPDDIDGSKLLDWLGFDKDWTIQMFKETLGYHSMYSGYRIIQADQVVAMFEANFLFQCVELTEDERVVAQRLMDQTVVEAAEIESRHTKETEAMKDD